MIEGLIGIAVAFLIIILVLLFGKRKADPKIGSLLHKLMNSQGFINLDLSDSKIKSVREAFKLTNTYPVYIEQAFHRMQDDLIVFWICKTTEGGNNALVAVIPQKIKTGQWILLHLPSLQGRLGNIVRKGFKLSLSSSFIKVKPEIFGQSSEQFELYIKKNGFIPIFHMDFFNILQQCGNFIIRSSGSIVLLERISLYKDETWEQEVKELLRITQLIREMI